VETRDGSCPLAISRCSFLWEFSDWEAETRQGSGGMETMRSKIDQARGELQKALEALDRGDTDEARTRISNTLAVFG
jgi:hypothetical protein